VQPFVGLLARAAIDRDLEITAEKQEKTVLAKSNDKWRITSPTDWPADQAAVIALAARAPRLTPERLDELAALAAPASGDGGRSGPEVTRRVLGVAQWVLGRR